MSGDTEGVVLAIFALGMFDGQLARAKRVLRGGPLGKKAGSKKDRLERERALVALEYMASAVRWLEWL